MEAISENHNRSKCKEKWPRVVPSPNWYIYNTTSAPKAQEHWERKQSRAWTQELSGETTSPRNIKEATKTHEVLKHGCLNRSWMGTTEKRANIQEESSWDHNPDKNYRQWSNAETGEEGPYHNSLSNTKWSPLTSCTVEQHYTDWAGCIYIYICLGVDMRVCM